MDLGCGGGDTIREVSRWASARGHRIAFTGLDRNPAMIKWSAALSADNPDISYITADVFDNSLLERPEPDVVMSSLFCHHFDDDLLIQLLKRMLALAGTAVIVNDLHRHPVAWHSIRLLTRLFSRSYLVRYDAPLSVARAFTRADWVRLLTAAGIREYSLRWCWAWRWQLIIPKQDAHGSV
jgi:SAM-dependent methyltransferase